MRFASSAGGPAPDASIVRELRRLDPKLYVIWRHFAFDAATGMDLLDWRGRRIPEPGWRVCLTDAEGREHVLFLWIDEQGNPLPLDRRVPEKIRSDVARHLTADEFMRRHLQAVEDEKADREKAWDASIDDFARANRTLLREALEREDQAGPQAPAVRDERVVSYPGQPVRAASRDSIRLTNRELGLEMPWPRDEE